MLQIEYVYKRAKAVKESLNVFFHCLSFFVLVYI